ncbi:hypothetical protein D3C81_1093590 [compost metagenome]
MLERPIGCIFNVLHLHHGRLRQRIAGASFIGSLSDPFGDFAGRSGDMLHALRNFFHRPGVFSCGGGNRDAASLDFPSGRTRTRDQILKRYNRSGQVFRAAYDRVRRFHDSGEHVLKLIGHCPETAG